MVAHTAMEELSASCSSGAARVADRRQLVFSTSGDLVCSECHAKAQSAAADERVTDGRTRLIVGTATVLCALCALGLFAYIYHDKHYVYVENGHVFQTSDASFTVLEWGIVWALLAALVGGFLSNWVVQRVQRV